MRAKVIDWSKTAATFLLLAGFLAFAFLVMFGMPVGGR